MIHHWIRCTQFPTNQYAIFGFIIVKIRPHSLKMPYHNVFFNWLVSTGFVETFDEICESENLPILKSVDPGKNLWVIGALVSNLIGKFQEREMLIRHGRVAASSGRS